MLKRMKVFMLRKIIRLLYCGYWINYSVISIIVRFYCLKLAKFEDNIELILIINGLQYFIKYLFAALTLTEAEDIRGLI